jgi:hypothetical protein
MTIQEIVTRLFKGLFFCTDPECWHGIAVVPLLFFLFMTCFFWAFVIAYFLWSHINKNPDRKNRLVELTYGPYSHWMTQPVSQADFLIGTFPIFVSGIWLCLWRSWRGKPLPKLYYCPAVAEDENYRKIFKEFPIFMKLLNLSYVLVFTCLASIAMMSMVIP